MKEYKICHGKMVSKLLERLLQHRRWYIAGNDVEKNCVNLKLKNKLSYKFIYFFNLFYKNISSRLFFI